MIFHDYYLDKGVRDICHEVKCGNPTIQRNAISIIAEEFISSGVVDTDSVLIPAPQHYTGKAEYTYKICEIVSQRTGCRIADILRRKPEESFYRQKKDGKVYEPRYYLDGALPDGKKYFFVDNVISTGDSFLVAKKLLGGKLYPLVYAVDYGRVKEEVLMDRENMIEFWRDVYIADQKSIKQGFRSAFTDPDPIVARTEYVVETFIDDKPVETIGIFNDYNEALDCILENRRDEKCKITRIDYDRDGRELKVECIQEHPGNIDVARAAIKSKIATFVENYYNELFFYRVNTIGMSEEQAIAAEIPKRDKLVNDLVVFPGSMKIKKIFERDYIDNMGSIYRFQDKMTFENAELMARKEYETFRQKLEEIKFMILDQNHSNYAIYQLRDDNSLHYHHFATIRELEKDGLEIDKKNYEPVYVGRLHENDLQKPTDRILDTLFDRFNYMRPEDFVGHSMSVSDVIALREQGTLKAYYVDSYGFKEIPEFIEQFDKEKEEYYWAYGQGPVKSKEANELGELTDVTLTDDQVQRERYRLYVDMDGTLADFEVVDTLEKLYEEGHFLNLKPNQKVVDAIKDIIKNNPDIDVYICSSYLSDSQYALKEKNEWVDRYIPEIPMERRIYPPCGVSKSEFILDKTGRLNEKDFLLDDYTINLNEWEPPAKGIKLLNGINHTKGTWKNNRVSYERSPEDMSKAITDMILHGRIVMDEPISWKNKSI